MTVTNDDSDWCKFDDWLRKKRIKRFAFTLHVEMSSVDGGTTLTLLNMGGSAIQSTTIEGQEASDSWLRHVRAIVEEHLSYLMQDKSLTLDENDIVILPGNNADDYSVTVSLATVETQFREPRQASSSSSCEWLKREH